MKLLNPKNRDENPRMAEHGLDFLQRLRAVSFGDSHTYKRILESLDFCVDWICVRENSGKEGQVLDIVEMLKQNIETAEWLWRQQREIRLNSQKQFSSGKGAMLLHQIQRQAAEREKKLKEEEEAINLAIMALSAGFSQAALQEKEETEEEEYILEESDYSYSPPAD